MNKIRYLQIEPSGQEANTNENKMFKIFVCTESPDEQSAFDGL